MNSNQIFSTLSAGIAFTGIAAGFVEEMVFRGVILNLLKENPRPYYGQIYVCSLQNF